MVIAIISALKCELLCSALLNLCLCGGGRGRGWEGFKASFTIPSTALQRAKEEKDMQLPSRIPTWN